MLVPIVAHRRGDRARVGTGARWITLINAGTIVLIAAVAFISRISAIDLIVSFCMAVVGFVGGLSNGNARRGGRGAGRPRVRRSGAVACGVRQ
jgi:hypothetical protein